MSAEEFLVKRISKDAPGVFYTYLPQRIITMAQAKDAMEQYSQYKADEQSVEFAMWVDKHYLAFNHGFVPVIGNRDTPISMEDLLARFKQEKQ